MTGSGFDIAEGDSLVIETGSFPCAAGRICTSYDQLCDDVQPGHRVLIDDGQIRLRAVANAILDGADAVMLSAETSVGRHPVETVRVIRGITAETEAFLATEPENSIPRVDPAELQFVSAVAHGASVLARELNVHLMGMWTETGTTVRLLSKRRIPQTIVGFAPEQRVCQRMSLYYGVQPVRLDRHERQRQMIKDVDRALLDRNLAMTNDMIMVIAGTHLRHPGATNAMLIHLVGTPDPAGPRAATPTLREPVVVG